MTPVTSRKVPLIPLCLCVSVVKILTPASSPATQNSAPFSPSGAIVNMQYGWKGVLEIVLVIIFGDVDVLRRFRPR